MSIIEKLGITNAPWSLEKEVRGIDKWIESADGRMLFNVLEADKPLSVWASAQVVSSAPELLEALINQTIFLESINGRLKENVMDQYLTVLIEINIEIINKATNKSWKEIKELIEE